jgi:hypothetical protein
MLISTHKILLKTIYVFDVGSSCIASGTLNSRQVPRKCKILDPGHVMNAKNGVCYMACGDVDECE